MAVRKILKMGDPLLRKTSEPVTEDEIRTKEFKKLVRDMFDTMKQNDGVGLAAPQIGELKQLLIVGHQESSRYPDTPAVREQIIINPVITAIGQETSGMWEGCLSVPGMRGYVERPVKIKMEWMNEKFEPQSEIFDDFQAVVFQHEVDHLRGVLYVDKLKSTKMFGFNDSLADD